MRNHSRPRLTWAQFAALDQVGLVYSQGKVSFEMAVECRDLIRAGQIDRALALLTSAEPKKLEALP